MIPLSDIISPGHLVLLIIFISLLIAVVGSYIVAASYGNYKVLTPGKVFILSLSRRGRIYLNGLLFARDLDTDRKTNQLNQNQPSETKE